MKNQQVEKWLKRYDVEFGYVKSLSLAEIDIEAGKRNQCRQAGVLMQDTVDRYALAMRAGDDFPAIVVYRGGKGYVPISGNHRIAAAIIVQRQYFDAYVVDTDDAILIDLLTRTSNLGEGLPESKASVLEHARYVVQAYNRPINEVATCFRIPKSTLHTAVCADETALKLGQLGVNYEGLNRTALSRLHQLRDDAVLVAATDLVRSAVLTTGEVGSLVTEVKQGSSEWARLAKVKEYAALPDMRKRIATGKRATMAERRKAQGTKGILFAVLGRLVKFLSTNPDPAVLDIVNIGDRIKLEKMFDQISFGIQSLFKRIDERLERIGLRNAG